MCGACRIRSGKAGIPHTLYDGVRENPTTTDADECLQAARDFAPDMFLAIGGGSPIDTAKGANILLTNGGVLSDYVGHGRVPKPMLPLIAIPTTAGTGSETQSFALIANSKTHAKMPIGDPKAAPVVALLDPSLTLTLPRRVTAHTGMDALAHAIESAVCRTANPVSRLFAREAFRRTAKNLVMVLEEPGNVTARGEMLLGAAYAGLAIENSMLGAAHSAANPLTAHFNIVHGQAVGMMLPYIIRYNGQQPDVHAEYAELLHAAGISYSRDSDPADILSAQVTVCLIAAGMPLSLSEYGVVETDIPRLSAEAAAQRTAQFNPRTMPAADFEKIYRAALKPHS